MTAATPLTRRVYAAATPPGQSSPRISINPMGNVPNKIREDFTLLYNPMKISAKLLLVATGRRWLILAGVCLRGREEGGTPARACAQGGSSHRDFTCGKVFSKKNAVFRS